MKPAVLLSALGLVLGCATAHLAGAAEPTQPEVRLMLPASGAYAGAIRNGVGQGQFSNGDRYEGELRNGKPDGIGKMSYMLGGAYEGEWKNGRRHGKGIMTFAGSGRRAEVRFEDGRRVDVATEEPPADIDLTRYWMLSGEDPTGSHIRNKVAYGPLPFDEGYDELTPEQQRLVRSFYPALDVGDQPPYPLRGPRQMVALVAYLLRYVDFNDELIIYVAVDPDGSVSTVSTISPIEAGAKRLVSAAAGLLKYQPARCGGQACAGVVPYRLQLRRTYGASKP